MKRLTFKEFFESRDIFGFDNKRPQEAPGDESLLMTPIHQFRIDELFALLKKKKIGTFYGEMTFPNVMVWGNQPGSIKLECDPGYRFSIKKLGIDKQGNHRWVTCKLFQLNRNGFGGYEDSVAQEMFEHLSKVAERNIEAPTEDYKDLDSLTYAIYNKLKLTAKDIFLPESVKKLHDNAYIIKFGLRAQGVEARDHQRIEQNQTYVVYDRDQGSIRIFNQNLQSKSGRDVEFNISQMGQEHYFFPTQERDEISEVIATFMKYY